MSNSRRTSDHGEMLNTQCNRSARNEEQSLVTVQRTAFNFYFYLTRVEIHWGQTEIPFETDCMLPLIMIG